MENEENKIRLTDYGYTPDAKVEVRGDLLLALLNFVAEVRQRETQTVLLYSRPQLKDNRDDQKKVLKLTDVSIENVAFENPAEFLMQEKQDALTLLGAKALDLGYVLEDLHYQAIQNKIAIKMSDLGTFNTSAIGNA